MARTTGGTGATDRLNIDGDLLDADREVVAVTTPDGEVLLFQEDPSGSIEAGQEVLMHHTDADDRPLMIGLADKRTTFDESVGERVTFETYPVIDLETDEEYELWTELPDDDHDSITPLTLIS